MEHKNQKQVTVSSTVTVAACTQFFYPSWILADSYDGNRTQNLWPVIYTLYQLEQFSYVTCQNV